MNKYEQNDFWFNGLVSDHSSINSFTHGSALVTPGSIILSKIGTGETGSDAVFSKLFRSYFGKSVSQMEQEDIYMLLAGFTYDPKICNFKFGNNFRFKLSRFNLGSKSEGKKRV